jgi:hypothetical protein
MIWLATGTQTSECFYLSTQATRLGEAQANTTRPALVDRLRPLQFQPPFDALDPAGYGVDPVVAGRQ